MPKVKTERVSKRPPVRVSRHESVAISNALSDALSPRQISQIPSIIFPIYPEFQYVAPKSRSDASEDSVPSASQARPQAVTVPSSRV